MPLNTQNYVTLVTDNNWLDETVKIYSDVDNIGGVYVRIVDGYGRLVDEVKYLSPGGNVSIGEIGKWDGTYKVQAKAASKAGTYYFTVRD